jgi:hypothetical protein
VSHPAEALPDATTTKPTPVALAPYRRRKLID